MKKRSEDALIISGKHLGLNEVFNISTVCLRNAKVSPWHEHGELEILVCLKGAHLYEFRNKPPQTLQAGSLLVVPPRLRHRLRDGIDDPGLRFCIQLKHPAAGRPSHGFFARGEYREVFSKLLEMSLTALRIPFFAERVQPRLFNLISRGENLSPFETVELRALVLFLIANITTSNRQPQNADLQPPEGIINQAVEWLEQHLDDRIAIDKLVEHIGYGRSRFYALFKRHTGLSPLSWITKRRIETAQKLMSTTDDPIAKIAKSVGFASPTFFTRTFRKITGRNPQEWRMSKAPSQSKRA